MDAGHENADWVRWRGIARNVGVDIHHRRHSVQGWREFLKEVGIIVMGVMIALGAEQTALAVHEARKAARAEGLVRDEFALNVAFAQEAVTPRMLSRLDELGTCALAFSQPPQYGVVLLPPLGPWLLWWRTRKSHMTLAKLPAGSGKDDVFQTGIICKILDADALGSLPLSCS